MKFAWRPSRVLVLALISGLCWLTQGIGQANLGNSTSLPKYKEHFKSLDSSAEGISASEVSHRTLISGLIVAIYELGLALGGLSTYFSGDWLGRKNSTYVAATVVIVGTVLESSAYSLGQLIVGRIVAGTGVGAITATAPAWMTESVSPKHRGALIMSGAGFAIGGVATTSWICLGMYIHQFSNEFGWRFPLAFQGIVAVIVMIAITFVDDSPRSLVRRGKRDKAYRVLVKNRSGHELELVDNEFAEIIQAYENELASNDKSPWAFNQHKQFRRTVTVVVLSAFCQLSGVNLITFYGAIIFEDDIGLSVVRSRVALAGLQTWQALCAASAAFFIAKFGRRNLMLWASAAMCICFCCNAGLDSTDSLDTKYGILAFDAVQLAAFPIGLFLNPFLIGSEISGLLCRSAVMACVSAVNWLMNFLLAFVTELGFQNIGYKYYIVYACTNAFLFIFSFLFLPDTTRLTLEEIDQAYVNSKTPFDIVRCMKAVRDAGHVPPEADFSSSKDDGKGSVEMIEDVEAEK